MKELHTIDKWMANWVVGKRNPLSGILILLTVRVSSEWGRDAIRDRRWAFTAPLLSIEAIFLLQLLNFLSDVRLRLREILERWHLLEILGRQHLLKILERRHLLGLL